MTNEVQPPPEEASMTSLMRGIINDLSDLIRQEVRFARTEIKTDLRKTREAATVLALGAGTAVLGVLLLALMLVFLLHWLSSPAGTDPGAIPLWGCFGIVSAVLLVAGGVLSWLGYKRFESFNPLPDETARSVKENVEWITNSR
jgi:Putative Actinobacterial Holin-X, holin superfamily III